LNLQGGLITNHGFVTLFDTNMAYIGNTISIGQLMGLNPTDGSGLTNRLDYLPLMADSLIAHGNVVAGGSFIGDGSGLSNIAVTNLYGTIDSELIASGAINSGKIADGTIGTNDFNLAELDARYINTSGDTIAGSLSIQSNLVVGTGTATGLRAVAEGRDTTATGDYSHAEGYRSNAGGNYSHAEGSESSADGPYSHAEGHYTTASGIASHAEGMGSIASGGNSHAEGECNLASGINSHAEGEFNTASAYGSHAEGGFGTTASAMHAHAEGQTTTASGEASHSEGHETTAGGFASHAAGKHARATNDYTYVWSDGTETGSTTTKQFTVYASNGIRLLGGPIEGDGSRLLVYPQGGLTMGSYTNGLPQ